jgi:hypothetical protein
MQVSFTNLLKAYSGKCDGIVYMFNRRLNKVIARRLPEFKPHAGTIRMGDIARNLKALSISAEFRSDLKLYTEMFRFAYPDQSCYTWMNAFSKLMWAMAKAYNLDLATITKADIIAQELPCLSVQRAVEAGLLLPVEGYQRLNAGMFG